MAPKVSVIIPVYNKASRIEVCLKSILSQDFQDYELLIIDDGSTDGSDAICLRYVDIMPDRISYARKENGGVSSARNTGIEKASGEYICFIDADDTIKSDFLSSLIKSAGRYDIVTCSNGLDRTWNGNEIAIYADTVGRTMLGTAVWGKLYKRSVIMDTDVRFDETVRFGEDTLFNLALWAQVKSIKAIPTNSYYYHKDVSRRYELSAEEIRIKIESLTNAYNRIDAVFGSCISISTDISITISLYPLTKVINDDTEYLQLYQEFFPKVSIPEFFNDVRCSPVLRAISESGYLIKHNGLKGLYSRFKILSKKYQNYLPLINCSFRFHKLLLFLLTHKMPYIAAYIVFMRNIANGK